MTAHTLLAHRMAHLPILEQQDRQQKLRMALSALDECHEIMAGLRRFRSWPKSAANQVARAQQRRADANRWSAEAWAGL